MKKRNLLFVAVALVTAVMQAQPPVIMGNGTGFTIGGPIPRFNGVNTVTTSILYQNGPNNIGVNTNTPQTPFHVMCNNNTNSGVRVDQNGNSASAVMLNNLSSGGRSWGLWSTGAGHTGWVGSFGINDNTANATRFVIDPLGQVGIGKLNPAMKLDVAGTFNADGESRFKDRIYAGPLSNFQKAIINVLDQTGGGYGSGGIYIQTNHTGSASYNTAIAVNQTIDQALTIFNTTMPMGGMFGFKELFTVMGDGSTTIAGSITNTSLAGAGNRSLLVDPSGKIIAGSAVSATGDWAVGGNSFGGFSSQILGTLTYDRLDVRTNNVSRIVVEADGKHLLFGHHPGFYAGNFDFNQDQSKSVLQVGAFGLNGPDAYPSSLVLANAYGAVEMMQDGKAGIGRLKWGTSDLLSFKGESMMIGTPGNGWDAGDINTKLVITTNSANGYTGFPLKIKNPSKTGANYNFPNNQNTVFEVLMDGTTHIGNKMPTGTHANAKLSVDGKIACQELIVWDPTKWADFVFERNYKLLPLADVEKYYLAQKHLPDVPSEKEVKEKGINSAEMITTLLQKVEELTIYLVEQDKKVKELQARLDAINKK